MHRLYEYLASFSLLSHKGAGSAGYGIFRILKEAGCRNIVVTDSVGAIYENRIKGIDNPYKKEIADKTKVHFTDVNMITVLLGFEDVFAQELCLYDLFRSFSS